MIRVLNLFDCSLDKIRELLPEIKKQGFNAVQISPLQKTKDDFSKEWWMLYQPLNFEIGNRIGSKDELKKLCLEADKYGIIIIADAVINHLANKSDSEPLTPHPLIDKDIKNNPSCFKEKKLISNWDNREEVTNYCMGLPGLNPNNELVQSKIIGMLNEYLDLGVNGFRFDAAKSIALPEEGCNFFPNITYSLKRWVPLIYGEVLFANEDLISKYVKYMKVLTNSDSWNKEGIIKFIENKDSFLSKDLGWTKYMPISAITNEYAALTGTYPNTKYYARNYTNDWKEWESNQIREANLKLVKKA